MKEVVGFERVVRVNRLLLMLIAALASLAACATPVRMAANDTDEARVRAEIMPLFTEMQAAANVHDAEAHLRYFIHDPALTFVVNGATIQGWDNLLAQQRNWWPGGRIAATDEAHQPYRLVEGPSFQLLGPRFAMLTFVLDARRVHPDRVMRRPLAISQLWEKRAEGWRIVYAHESLGPERPVA
jgi:ketosteroid isomerase-like protein